MTDEPISKRIPNRKHRLFIDELLRRNMNQTAAYMAVYPDASYDTARANALTLLANTNISDEVERRLRERAMGVDEIIARLADQARGSLADFKGVRSVDDLEDHPLAHLVKEAEEVITESAKGKLSARFKIKLHDPQAALVQLGKMHGLFTDKVELTWKDKLPEGYDPSDVKQQFINIMRQAAKDANSD